MRIFAQTQKATLDVKSARSAGTPRSPFGHSFDVHSILDLQGTVGNHAVQRLLKSNAEKQKNCSLPNGPPRFGHDFSRIQVHDRADIQAKMEMNAPGDMYEQEAERVADQVVGKPDSQLHGQQVENGSEAGRSATPDTIGSSAGGGGQFLGNYLRSYFEPRFGYDFSRVRIHNDAEASNTAKSLNARAFTIGRDIVFRRGAYAPHTNEGQHLMAHELTHVVQQGGAERVAGATRSFLVAPGYIQRDIVEDQLPTTPVEQIMADENYFEKGIERIEFFSGELAILHYGDKSEIHLGLTPEQIKPPFEAVDYQTPRSTHLPVTSTAPSLGQGSIRFLPRGREAQFPPGFTSGDIPRIMEQVGRTIRFTHHPNGRIVPTEVNSISAPRLSQALREAEAEYVRRIKSIAAGGIEVLERLQWIIIVGALAMAEATGGGAAGRTGAAAAPEVLARAQSSLVGFFTRLLGSGATETITVEGVSFGGVRVAMRGTDLTATRYAIYNVERIPGQGRLIHGAFERAAIQVARQVGARTAQVALETVQNPAWRAYLESQGYMLETILKEGGGFTVVYMKVFTL